MRRFLALLLIGSSLVANVSSTALAQNTKNEALLNCNTTEEGGRTAPIENGSVESNVGQCQALVCSALLVERETFYAQLSDYPVALDEPFEEIFVRLKGGLQNYATTLEGICGVEVNPLPLCGGVTSTDGSSLLNTLGAEATTIRTKCTAEVQVLVDIGDTVIRELLLRLAGDQRIHAYARRIDVLSNQFRELNKIVASIGKFLAKISLPTVVGDAPKQ